MHTVRLELLPFLLIGLVDASQTGTHKGPGSPLSESTRARAASQPSIGSPSERAILKEEIWYKQIWLGIQSSRAPSTALLSYMDESSPQVTAALRYLLRRQSKKNSPSKANGAKVLCLAMLEAVKYERDDVIRDVIHKYSFCPCKKATNKAARLDNSKILQLIIKDCPYNPSHRLLNYLASIKKFDILRLLRSDNPALIPQQITADSLAQQGNLDDLLQLKEATGVQPGEEALEDLFRRDPEKVNFFITLNSTFEYCPTQSNYEKIITAEVGQGGPRDAMILAMRDLCALKPSQERLDKEFQVENEPFVTFCHDSLRMMPSTSAVEVLKRRNGRTLIDLYNAWRDSEL